VKLLLLLLTLLRVATAAAAAVAVDSFSSANDGGSSNGTSCTVSATKKLSNGTDDGSDPSVAFQSLNPGPKRTWIVLF
jgi:hypothetical protein